MKSSKEESLKIRPHLSSSYEESVNELLSDNAIKAKMKELGVDEASLRKNLPLFLTYQECAKECEKCKGMEYCSLSPEFHTMDLFIDDSGLLNRRYGYCKYLMAKEKIKNGYLYRDFPEEMLSLSIATLPNKADAKKFALRCSSSLGDDNSLTPWVYLEGESGVGKTTLAVSLMNGFIKSGDYRIAYLDSVKRFDELKNLAIKNKALFDMTMDSLSNAEILVLDSFGNEFKSNYVRDQLLMPLLSARAKKNLFTLFCSEFSYEEIEAMYSYSRDASVLAKRLKTLLMKKCGEPFLLKGGFQSYL